MSKKMAARRIQRQQLAPQAENAVVKTPQATLPEKIVAEDILALIQAKSKYMIAQREARNYELEYQNVIKSIYIKYSLATEDGIDENSGLIVRKGVAQ